MIRLLKDGDILNVDVTPILDGYFGDTSRMFVIGEGVRGSFETDRGNENVHVPWY